MSKFIHCQFVSVRHCHAVQFFRSCQRNVHFEFLAGKAAEVHASMKFVLTKHTQEQSGIWNHTSHDSTWDWTTSAITVLSHKTSAHLGCFWSVQAPIPWLTQQGRNPQPVNVQLGGPYAVILVRILSLPWTPKWHDWGSLHLPCACCCTMVEMSQTVQQWTRHAIVLPPQQQ